jgi:hypothetical protein
VALLAAVGKFGGLLMAVCNEAVVANSLMQAFRKLQLLSWSCLFLCDRNVARHWLLHFKRVTCPYCGDLEDFHTRIVVRMSNFRLVACSA